MLAVASGVSGCANGTAPGFRPPDLAGVVGDWTQQEIDCSDTPVWIGLVDEPGVQSVSCGAFEGVDPVGGPDALLSAVIAEIGVTNPDSAVIERSCSPRGAELGLASTSCFAWTSMDTDSTSRVKTLIYLEADPSDVGDLLEKYKVAGSLQASDYEGVELTAWVAVAFGDPTI
jgi:hypothetical protein